MSHFANRCESGSIPDLKIKLNVPLFSPKKEWFIANILTGHLTWVTGRL